MKILFPILLIAFLISCKKEEPVVDIENIKGKYLVCDSIKTTQGGKASVSVKGIGTGADIMIDTNRILTIYTTPNKLYSYRLRGINLYFWTKGTDPHAGDYYVIYNKTASKVEMEIEDKADDNYVRYYFTVN